MYSPTAFNKVQYNTIQYGFLGPVVMVNYELTLSCTLCLATYLLSIVLLIDHVCIYGHTITKSVYIYKIKQIKKIIEEDKQNKLH